MALGEKADEDDRVSDKVALFRTLLIIQAIITNIFIVIGIIHKW